MTRGEKWEMTSVHALAFSFWADLMMVYMIMFCRIVMHIGARTKPWILTTPLVQICRESMF